MKPREFDELVRQKFDQNDFAYNGANWDRLAEQLDGRAKKRSMIMWLWMPAAAMAASVALAIGVTSLLRFGMPENAAPQYAHTKQFVKREAVQQPMAMVVNTPPYEEAVPQPKPIKKSIKVVVTEEQGLADKGMGIKLENINANTPAADQGVAVVTNSEAPKKVTLPKIEDKAVAVQKVYKTFREDMPKVRKVMNLSVILSGGVSQGNRNSGYMAGATVRKMINDKVYVESDIAFATSDNTQRTQYMSYENAAPSGGGGTGSSGATAARPSSASKTTTTTTDGVNTVPNGVPNGVVKTQDISYNLYYAQITPGIGYKIMKRMSVGVGPDFQKMLVDNRPATSEVDRGNLQVAPTFDVGWVGKTEYALTDRVKAAVSYRKGINGVINPSDKYIDRDYLQFQMRCTIFNR